MTVHRSSYRIALLLLSLVILCSGSTANAATGQFRVLVLHSTRQDTELSMLTDRSLPQLLGIDGLPPIDYYAEHFDLSRIPAPVNERAIRALLRLKYAGTKFDLVVAIEDSALRFIRTYRAELFGTTPVIFSSESNNLVRPPNSAGVIAPLNLASTIDLALRLQPDTNRLFIVSGSSPRDKVYEAIARRQLGRFRNRLELTYLSDMPRTNLERRLATLPARSIVYYLMWYQDSRRDNFNPLDILSRLAAVANRPTYSWVSSTMNRGIIGGRMRDQPALIDAIAYIGRRVLRGEPIDRIPLTRLDSTIPQVDWRQLQRWRIDETRVPVGTRVQFRPSQDTDIPQPSWMGWAIAMASLLVAAVAAYLVAFRQRRSRSINRLRIAGRNLGRLLKAQEDERSRLAMVLHNDLGQQAAVLAIELDRAMRNRTATKKLVRDARSRARIIADTARGLSQRLHPAKLEIIGLSGALMELPLEFSDTGTAITVSTENVDAKLEQDVSLCLFRAAQEGVQNAITHGGGRHVRIHLSGVGKMLTLTVEDDGIGFDPGNGFGRGLGLMTINERVAGLGGTLKVVSRLGAGTHLHVSVPLVRGRQALDFAGGSKMRDVS